MDSAMTQLRDRLSTLEQENAILRSRLQSCEQSYSLLQAQVLGQGQCQQNRLELTSQESLPETAANNSHSIEHRLLEATAQAANALLTIAHFDRAVNTALQILGESLDTDRINVIENFDLFSDSPFPSWRVLEYEWTSLGTVPQHANGKAGQGSYEEIKLLYELFQQGQTASYLIDEAPEPFRSEQIAIGVKSTHLVPIFVEGQWWGVLGLDDCRKAKQRSKGELAILKVAADCIGSAIQRDRTQQVLLQAEQERTCKAAEHSQELERLNAELQHTLDRLSESEERYRTLFELSSEGIYRWELDQPLSIALPVDEQVEQLRRSLYVAEANAAYAAMYDLPTTEAASGLRLSDAHISTSDKNLEFLRQWIENGYRIRSAELEAVNPEGKRCYFFNNVIGIVEEGQLIGGWATQLDISELRETQQALLAAEQKRSQELKRINAELQQALDHLAESEKRYRTLFELSSEGIVRFGYEQPIPIALPVDEQLDLCYRSIYMAEANSVFAAMYECEKVDDLVGVKLSDLHDRTSEITQATMRTWVENRYFCHQLETVEFDRQGQKHYFLCSASSTIENDCVTSTWVSQVDITELRETQQALLEAEQKRVAELAKANEELQQREHEVQRSYRLLSVVAQVTKDLLEAEDVDVAIPAALQTVGEVAKMSRVQLLLERHEPTTQKLQHVVTYEWAAEGIIPQINHPDAAVLDNDNFEFMLQDLHAGRSIWHIVEGFPSPVREQFEAIGIKSCGTVPIFIESRYIGGVGFDDCVTPRQWSQQEIDVLTTAAESIGAALHRKQLVDRLIDERTRAAQERAAELVKANEALKRSLDALALEPSLDKFLGQVLTAISEQLQAPQVEYWYHPTEHCFHIGLMVQQGAIYSRSEIAQLHPDHPGVVGAPIPQEAQDQPIHQYREYFIRDNSDIPLFREHAERYALGLYQELTLPLILGEMNIGMLVIRLPRRYQLTNQQIELAQALAHQATLAVRLTQLTEEAKQAAIAREQEKVAQERAAELARSNEALQQTIDTLGTLSSFDEFIPAVLRIVAQTFNATDCGYYEHSQDEIVYLRYWFSQGIVLNPTELQLLDPQQNSVLLQLINGFTVPPEHLHGTTVRDRTRPVVINHTTANTVPEFHAFAVSQGWELELNQPLLVEGKADGALIIYRKLNQPFTEAERMLAEALAKQLALAMQASRLATESKSKAVEAAIAREQEKAAQERAAELAKANDALKRSLDALATDPELDQFLVHVLREITQQVDLCTVYLFMYDPNANTLTLRISLKDNQIHFGSLPDDPPLFSQPFSTDISPAWQYSLSHHKFIFQPVGAEDGRTWDETKAWHVANGHSAHGGIALVAGNQPVGYLGMAWRGKESIAVEQAELIEALANQATLAIQLTQLAEEAKQAAQQSAILGERNRMARELHDTLAQTFTGIIMQLEAAQQMIANTASGAAQKHFTHAGLLARQGLQEARRSVWSLRPEALDSHDLYMALLQMVQKMTEHTTLQTAVIVDGTPISLPSEIEDHLLRIGQESLTNALKYAQAQTIQIKLCFAIDAVELQVLDDGQGFDPQQRRHGFGITCIQERTHQMGGDFTLTSQIGHGTIINVRIPLV